MCHTNIHTSGHYSIKRASSALNIDMHPNPHLIYKKLVSTTYVYLSLIISGEYMLHKFSAKQICLGLSHFIHFFLALNAARLCNSLHRCILFSLQNVTNADACIHPPHITAIIVLSTSQYPQFIRHVHILIQTEF